VSALTRVDADERARRPGQTAAPLAEAGPSRRLSPLGTVLVLLLGVGLSLPPADYALHRGRVHARVAVAWLDLGGMTSARAREALERLAESTARRRLRFVLGGRAFEATLRELGWRPDLGATWRAAVRLGRDGRLVEDLAARASAWLQGASLPLAATWDLAALLRTVGRWDASVRRPPREGEVRVEDGEVVASFPRPGTRVDAQAILRLASGAVDGPPRGPLPLPLAPVPPRTSPEQVAQAAREARALLAGPVTVRLGELTLRIRRDQLAPLLQTTLVPAGERAWVMVSFSSSGAVRLLAPFAARVERPPTSARFVVQGSRVRILPSSPGRRLDPDLAAERLARIARQADRAGRIPLAPVPPSFSTEDARALGIVEEVSSFTTYHAPGEPRVVNIHRAADLLDGTIVMPGETFSLNRHLGERTVERGFVLAPAIINGRFALAVGGGVSQLATTLFNAVFFGGYPILEHRAHSYYISRYPLGREATLSWGGPDLVFRNDTPTAVLIHTEYTDHSITVRLFGARHGRTVRATDPVIVGRGAYGYTVRVDRIVLREGREVRRETFTTFYRYGSP
jgi:vancomycin resistance protein YoaR